VVSWHLAVEISVQLHGVIFSAKNWREKQESIQFGNLTFFCWAVKFLNICRENAFKKIAKKTVFILEINFGPVLYGSLLLL
jgi:hypothetical protein